MIALALAAGISLQPLSIHADESVWAADVAFALDELERQCGALLAQKDVDWKRVRKEFSAAAKDVESDGEHLVLLTRLVARLRDGHAEVQPLEKGRDVTWPDDGLGERTGPGFFLCRSGKKTYVKNAWGDARGAGLEPGFEVLKIDGEDVDDWLEAREERVRDLVSFSTDHHAFYFTCHQGLADPVGTRLKLECRTPEQRKTKKTIVYAKASTLCDGPAYPPEGVTREGRSIFYGKTPSGTAYLHVRRIDDDVIESLDRALAAVGDAPGLILDFRGNSGGGCDHDAFEARFVPRGAREMPRLSRPPLASAGAAPYGGPVVVIVDGSVRSAGETVSGMFKEDGRAYMIGESPTAGMSAQKTLIELPSSLFALRVAVGTHRGSFNGGEGIEGIGVVPHEIVAYDPEHLAAERDTLILRAEALLESYPKSYPTKDVAYDPQDYGWSAE